MFFFTGANPYTIYAQYNWWGHLFSTPYPNLITFLDLNFDPNPY